jgi:hypothetical protein
MMMMTRQEIESAVASSQPFELRMPMAKSTWCRIDYISLPPKVPYVIVYDDQGHFTVLPLLTVTGLQSKVR